MNGTKVKFPWKRRPGLHKSAGARLDWKHREAGEAPALVRGTSRRVVVVKSPDPRIFEEAIFIIREDLFHRSVSAESVLAEAKKAAGSYLRASAAPRRGGRGRRLSKALYAGLGGLAAGLAWLAFRLVGV